MLLSAFNEVNETPNYCQDRSVVSFVLVNMNIIDDRFDLHLAKCACTSSISAASVAAAEHFQLLSGPESSNELAGKF